MYELATAMATEQDLHRPEYFGITESTQVRLMRSHPSLKRFMRLKVAEGRGGSAAVV